MIWRLALASVTALFALLPGMSPVQGANSLAGPGCDFDGDTYEDLAVGMPFEDIDGAADAGAVSVIYGTASGLGTGGRQLWVQGPGGLAGNLEAGDRVGSSLACGDFDGDGYDDLAVGADNEDIGATTAAGAVSVIYGSASGLGTAGRQVWYQGPGGLAGSVEERDQVGWALASGDFDGDGYDDLAIGVPFEDIDTTVDAGAVNVIYGGSSGLTTAGRQLWYQGSGGLAGSLEVGDWVGAALASGDFDGDGYDDLAIGVPFEDIGSTLAAGAVNVVYGRSSGLSTSGRQVWFQGSGGLAGVPESPDIVGSSLASGDFNGDGRDDLAIGAQLEDIGTTPHAGAVDVIYGSASGLGTGGRQIWYQGTGGLLGSVEEGDRVGSSLASGDFNGDGRDDLAIGVPFEDIDSTVDAGAVDVIYGGSSGLSTPGRQIWYQGTGGLAGNLEQDDAVSISLASDDFDGDGRDDLAIGVPFEDIGTIPDACAVDVNYGGASGLATAGRQVWYQGSGGLPGSIEAYDCAASLP